MNGPADHARGWIRKADSDLATARLVLAGPGPYDTACFHAQQAIEKCLKALIAYSGSPIPHIHDLKKLGRAAQAAVPVLEFDQEELARITPFAVGPRYDEDFWPDRDNASRAVATAEEVRARVLGTLPPEAHPE